ncbi:MAG: hypothetical protein V2A73_16965 [Pseudomonadota bacterium]
MLINSNTVKGKCPVCGAANCACGGPSKVIPVDQRVTTVGTGPLTSYPLGRGASIVLTEDMARARGLLPPKVAEPVQNKKRSPAQNKGVNRG